jgi:hypothetical protein
VALSLPSAQGGVGPFQYFATEALLKFGVLKSAAAAYSLALHVLLVGPVSLIGVIVLWRSTLPGVRAARRGAIRDPALNADLTAGTTFSSQVQVDDEVI